MRRWITYLLVRLGIVPKPRFLVRYAERHPTVADLSDDDLVVVRSGQFTKWACLRCPCGCGEKIALSLAENRRPMWRIQIDWLLRPSVRPSIWLKDGCFSHFWLTQGQVIWVEDSASPRISA